MTSSHPYGPHRPEDAPNVVTVLGSGKFPAPELRPIPAALVAQRERINYLAHHTKHESNSRLVEAANTEPDQLATYACSCGSWHFYVGGAATCPDGEPVGPHE